MIDLIDSTPEDALHITDRKGQAKELYLWLASEGDGRQLVVDMDLPSLLSLIERAQELRPDIPISVLYDPSKLSSWLSYFKPTFHASPDFGLTDLLEQRFAEAEILSYVEETDPNLVRLELSSFGVSAEPVIRSVEPIYLKLLVLVLYWCHSTSSKEPNR